MVGNIFVDMQIKHDCNRPRNRGLEHYSFKRKVYGKVTVHHNLNKTVGKVGFEELFDSVSNANLFSRISNNTERSFVSNAAEKSNDITYKCFPESVLEKL